MTPVYIASSNLLGQRLKMDMISDNIANASTPGFKHQKVDFSEIVSRKRAETVGSFNHHRGTRTNFVNGSFTKTDNPLDVALEGKGFFAIEKDGQVLYTRNGSFTINSEGNLTTHEGHPVLDGNNAGINIPPDSTQLSIAPDGSVSDENGVITNLGIFEFDNPQMLKRAGNSGWVDTVNGAVQAETTRVSQGYIENANVNPIQETVNMTDMLRAYQGTVKMIGEMEGLEERVIRNLSRLP